MEQSVKNVENWKAHLLRSINQDLAKHDILEGIDDQSVLLVSDRVMRYIPKKYRESQRDWSGKRGISWHITVAIKKNDNDEIQMLTFVHIFEKCNQDGPAVVAILTMFSNRSLICLYEARQRRMLPFCLWYDSHTSDCKQSWSQACPPGLFRPPRWKRCL